MRLFWLCYLFIFWGAYAQTPPTHEVEVDLSEFCHDQEIIDEQKEEEKALCLKTGETPLPSEEEVKKLMGDLASLNVLKIATPEIEAEEKNRTCAMINHLALSKTPPVEITIPKMSTVKAPLIPKVEEKWKIRFSFGFARTKYYDTDLYIKSERIDVRIKDFSWQERTSGTYYDPKNWKEFQDGFRWIDEPSNKFIFTAEKNNNVLYLTIFHPKFLKEKYQVKQVTGMVDGIATDQVMMIEEKFDDYNRQPGEMYLASFANSHKQMTWQIGYGRQFHLYKSPNEKFDVRWTPHVHAGLMSGRHYSSYSKKDEYWANDSYEDKDRIHGVTLSAGHSLEVQYGRFSLFADQQYTYSKVKHPTLDSQGSAQYKVKFLATTFGVGFDLYNPNKKKKK
jgi:hypothetical protein